MKTFGFTTFTKIFLMLLAVSVIFVLESSAQSSKVSGKIIDETGESLSLVTVELLNKNNKVIKTTVTDMDGCYTFEVPHMKYETIKINLLGYSEKIVNAHLPSPTISMTSLASKEDTSNSAFIEQKIGLK